MQSAESNRSLRQGWGVVIAYALVGLVCQALWLTYATITGETSKRYGVSVADVGWLAEIFPLLYVLLAVPAGILLDRWFRPVLAVGGALVAVGGLLRVVEASFTWALAGQALVSIAQPLVVSAVGKVAAEYLPPRQRPAAIAICSASGFAGMLLALLLGPLLAAHGHLWRLLIVEAALGVPPALMLALALRAPARSADGRAALEGSALRALWRLPAMRALCGLAFLGFGLFVALTTWLQALLQPSHVSETTSGAMLVAMILTGTIGSVVLPPLVTARGIERPYLTVCVSCAATCCLACGAAQWTALRALTLVLLGALMLPVLPMILTAAERLAGPAAGSAGAAIWMIGNLGGLVIAVVVQALVGVPLAAFATMSGGMLLALPLLRHFPASRQPG